MPRSQRGGDAAGNEERDEEGGVMSVTVPVPVPQSRPTETFTFGRVLQLVFGSLGLLAALAFITAGGALTWALETQRDSSGYFTTATQRLETSGHALASTSLEVDSGWPDWALGDRFASVRISATNADDAKPLFIGIARTVDVNRYLTGVEHDQVANVQTDPFTVDYDRTRGGSPADPPAANRSWRTQASGTGTQTIVWPVEEGHWSALAMNSDGSRPVSVDVQFGARVPFLWWLVAGLFVFGGLSLLGGGALLYLGARMRVSATKEA